MIYVAELSINHLGMLNIAKAMIKSAKASGQILSKLKLKRSKIIIQKNHKNGEAMISLIIDNH